MENDTNINFDILDTKRSELYQLRKKKMEWIKVRSRARWISEGEKTTKYFCNLEKQNFVSKCMNSLVKNCRTKITDQDEILQERFLFYKTVYAKRVCTEADLFDPLNKFQVPK